MIKSPKISAVLRKKHEGEVVISLNEKIIATGKTSLIALKKAQKIDKKIDKKEFLISRIYPKYIAA